MNTETRKVQNSLNFANKAVIDVAFLIPLLEYQNLEHQNYIAVRPSTLLALIIIHLIQYPAKGRPVDQIRYLR